MEINPHTKELALARAMPHMLTDQELLNIIVAHSLSGRALPHDLSKFAPDELSGIAEEKGLNSPKHMEALNRSTIQPHITPNATMGDFKIVLRWGLRSESH